MTLTEFLTARLDEDEALARDAYYDGQMWVPEEEAVVAADRDLDPVLFLDRKRDAQHAANWSPARVLAQVAAMRAIVDLHEQWPVLVETPPEMSTATDDTGNMTVKMAKQVAWLTNQEYRQRFGTEPPTAPMLRYLAAIWSSHPDYDPAWAPEGE